MFLRDDSKFNNIDHSLSVSKLNAIKNFESPFDKLPITNIVLSNITNVSMHVMFINRDGNGSKSFVHLFEKTL